MKDILEDKIYRLKNGYSYLKYIYFFKKRFIFLNIKNFNVLIIKGKYFNKKFVKKE